MAAKTAAQRQQEKRDRDKKSEQEREALLLSRQIVTKLYHNDDAALKRVMARAKIEEEQDMISRLIRGADRIIEQDDFDSHIRIA